MTRMFAARRLDCEGRLGTDKMMGGKCFLKLQHNTYCS